MRAPFLGIALSLVFLAPGKGLCQADPLKIERRAKSEQAEVGLMPGVPLAPHHPDASLPMHGVIDSGVQVDHPQIGDVVGATRDFTGEGFFDSSGGHGTKVVLSLLHSHYEDRRLGRLEQLRTLFPEIAGLPRVAVAKVVGRRRATYKEIADRMAAAVGWMGELDIHFVNISIALPGGEADYSALCDAIAGQSEILFSIAAGNLGAVSVAYPASCPASNIAVIGAVLPDGTVPDYSGPAAFVAELPPALLPPAQYFLGLANELAQAGELDKAEEAYRSALGASPTPPEYTEAIVALSVILTRRKKFEEALRWLQEGLEQNPTDGRLLDRKIRVLLDLGRSREALEALANLEQVAPKTEGLAELRFAAQNFQKIEKAVERGADAHALLFVFAEQGDAQLVRFTLRRFDLDPNRIPKGQAVAPLIIAATRGHVPAMNELVTAGADVNARDPKLLLSAMMAAANQGHSKAVEFLISLGADLNATDYYGFTALMFAAEKGKDNVVQLLIGAGADLSRKSVKGIDAIGYAEKYGHQAAALKISEALANPPK